MVFAQTDIRLISDLNLLYHEKGSRQAWDIWFVSNRIDAKFKIKETPVFISILQKKDFLYYSNIRQKQTFSLVSSSTEFSGGLHYNWRSIEFIPFGTASFGNQEYRLGGGLQLKVEVLPGFKLLGDVTIRQVPYKHTWKVEDIKPEFQQWGKVKEFKFGLDWVWNSGFLNLTHQVGESTVSGQKQIFSESGEYKNQSTTLKSKIAIGQTYWVQADINLYNGNGFPVWSYKQFPFSGFEAGSSSHHVADIKLIRSKSQNWKPFVGLTYSELSLKTGGLLQSHPFTPAIFSLIGDYYFFSIDQIVRIPGFYLGSDYTSDGNWSANFSFGWQKARPKLQIKTWEPLFLLFGRKNERTTHFSYQYVDLIPVKSKISMKFAEIRFECEISQQIPIHAVKNPKKPSTSGAGGVPNPTSGHRASEPEKSVWGGTEFKLTLHYNL